MTVSTTRPPVAKGRPTGPHKLLDTKTFFKPIAHRGLHNKRAGVIENTGPAFRAALAAGYGIECDLQPAADGTPMVFHDDKLGRLVDAKGLIRAQRPRQLAQMRYRGQDTPIMRFTDLLDLVGGRCPLLVEIKADRRAPP